MEHHSAYQAMYTLSQDYDIDEARIKKFWGYLLENKKFRYQERLGITQEQMFQAIENK